MCIRDRYQHKWGKNVIPSDSKINLEVLLNKLDITFKLLIFYTLIGGLLLILGFVELFKPKKILHRIIKGIIYLGAVGYIIHFLGLIARWYISGHAPVSYTHLDVYKRQVLIMVILCMLKVLLIQ